MFRFQFDDTRLSEVRSVTARARKWWLWPTIALAAALWSAAFAVTMSGGLALAIVAYVSLVALFGSVIVVVRMLLRRRLRRHTSWGQEIESTVSEEGLFERGPDAEVRLRWSAFGRAIRYADGVLLYRSGQPIWLALHTLAAGTVEELDELLVRHLPKLERSDKGARAESRSAGARVASGAEYAPPRGG